MNLAEITRVKSPPDNAWALIVGLLAELPLRAHDSDCAGDGYVLRTQTDEVIRTKAIVYTDTPVRPIIPSWVEHLHDLSKAHTHASSNPMSFLVT